MNQAQASPSFTNKKFKSRLSNGGRLAKGSEMPSFLNIVISKERDERIEENIADTFSTCAKAHSRQSNDDIEAFHDGGVFTMQRPSIGSKQIFFFKDEGALRQGSNRLELNDS